jgi:hypothetical protein
LPLDTGRERKEEHLEPSRDNYIKNLRFYARLFHEHQWQTQEIANQVFVVTLNEIAEDFATLQKENELLRKLVSGRC